MSHLEAAALTATCTTIQAAEQLVHYDWSKFTHDHCYRKAVIEKMLFDKSVDIAMVIATTQLVDCVWSILTSGHRSRESIIRHFQSNPETVNIVTSISGNVSDSENTTSDNGIPSLRTNTVSTESESRVHPTLAHSMPAVSNSEEQFRSNCNRPTSRKRHAKRTETVNESDHDNGPAPIDAGSCKRRRVSQDDADENKHLQANPPPSSTSSAQNTFQKGGKTRQLPAPNFGNRKFSMIQETLRSQVHTYKGLEGLRDSWKTVDAFRLRAVEQLLMKSSDSRIVQERYWQEELRHALRKKSSSLSVRALVVRRFNMVRMIAQYHERQRVNGGGDGSSDIKEEFKKELFPGKTPKQAESDWYSYHLEAEVLLAAVRRYGYGVLIFPLRKVTRESLRKLDRKCISDFIDYLGQCHPDLEK
ncbi:hypothetical protein VFPPC_11490 [Pochonia chlamydosporia 170]|uniref:Uncharacterized protein n=1 Tax=Pochonia chlamydosporia 170 TaxID=1380566 RepID=A0A179F0L1_METCM|nr:hypothetical protein VFPPC_11490 [Pochonia chlamydosporia 170]OAQ58995.2 hypothetical protein VFPPC_11490 [Pochonia chlamydosporia 170]